MEPERQVKSMQGALSCEKATGGVAVNLLGSVAILGPLAIDSLFAPLLVCGPSAKNLGDERPGDVFLATAEVAAALIGPLATIRSLARRERHPDAVRAL